MKLIDRPLIKILIVYFIFSISSFYITGDNQSQDWGSSFLSKDNSLITNSETLLNERPLDTENTLIANDFLSGNKDLLSNESSLVRALETTTIGGFSSMKEISTSDPSETEIQISFTNTYETTTIDSFFGDIENFYVLTLSDDFQQFSDYFTEWEKSPSTDFLEWSKKRYTQEELIRNLYDKALKEFGVGTSIICLNIVVFSAATGPVHAIAYLMLTSSIECASVGSIVGAIGNAIVSTINNDPTALTFAKTLEGMANGYMIGAITGTAKGLIKGINKFSGTKKIKEGLIRKDGAVFNEKGKLIGEGYFAPNGEITHYSTNGILKDIKDGRIIGRVSEKNGFKFLTYDEETRPFAVINSNGEIVTNNTLSLKSKGLKITSLSSDKVNPSSSQYYNTLYAVEHPTIDMSQWKGANIHHSIEQQVLTRYPGVFSDDEVLRIGKNLRGIPKVYNSEIHLSEIRQAWNDTYDKINSYLLEHKHLPMDKQKEYIRNEILKTQAQIDKDYGEFFIEKIVTMGEIL